MEKKHYVVLKATEAAILQAAATIYSASIQVGEGPENQEEKIQKAVDQAITMTLKISEQVRCEHEMG